MATTLGQGPASCNGANDADGKKVIRVLLIGCGDVALRTARLLHPKVRLYGLTRRVEDVAKLRAHGVVPIVGDLDRLRSLDRLRAAPFAVLHFAPPPSDGRDDARTQRLIAILARARSIPQRFVYISTSGVYGDCAGARVDETRPRRAGTPRSRRRVAAEDRLRDWAKRYGVALSILRAPEIGRAHV
jgi:nucleoside-diphosphate-sugar epimerase